MFFSASQDIAIDAYRTDVATAGERGPAATATQLGYRVAAWLAFALALVVADHLGWRIAFLVLAAVMLLFCIVTVRAPSSHNSYRPSSLSESVIEPLKELLGSPSAVALLLVVLLFKVGDAFANKLFTPFMMDTGFSKTEIALIIKVLFVGSTLVGVVLGGLLMVRLGLLRSMLGFGVLQALSNLLYCLLAVSGKSYPIMVAAVVIEHIAGAMGGIALVALIMALCDARYSAFQFALLSALALLPRYTLGGPAGWIADHAGLVRVFRRQLHPGTARTGDRVAEAPADRGTRQPRARAPEEQCQAAGELIDLQRVVCRVADLEEHATRAFTIGAGDWPLRGFVVRAGAEVHGYLNRCPHAGHPLDLIPGRFLTADRLLILCASHGALFEKSTGAVRGGAVPRALADARAAGGA